MIKLAIKLLFFSMFFSCSTSGQDATNLPNDTTNSDTTSIATTSITSLEPVRLNTRIGDTLIQVIQQSEKIELIRFDIVDEKTRKDSTVYWKYKVDTTLVLDQNNTTDSLVTLLTKNESYDPSLLLPRCPFNPIVGYKFTKKNVSVLAILSTDGCNLARFFMNESNVTTLDCTPLVTKLEEFTDSLWRWSLEASDEN